MIYNTLDQVIGTQDSVQRMKAPQEWTVTKYDAMGRPVITGIFQHTGSTAGVNNLTIVQGLADAVTTQWETTTTTGTGYTSNAWPTTINTVLGVAYYDSYSGIPNLPSMYNQLSNTLYSSHTIGLITATKTLVLNTTADYLWSVPYYDEDGQVIRTFTQHYLGGSSALSQYNYDDIQTNYNFNDQPVTVARYHNVKNSGGTAATLSLTSTDLYTYDHMGRKLKSYNTLKDGANAAQAQVLVAQSNYNELGQLKQKGLHSLNGTSFLQNVDYRYNARGWLTNINNGGLTNDQYTSTDLNDQFGMDLKYDDAASPQYNGNIGNVKTLTGTVSGNSYPALTYNYTYDKLNRLTDAISTTATTGDGFYSENLVYDVMGNIQALKRYEKNGTAAQLIDNLSYTYVSGNKVDRIDDTGTTAGFNNAVSQAGEYTYDGNGSQLTDLNRGLTQAYNMLNLPQTVTKSGVSIAYIYDATGRKLRKLSTASGTTTVTEYIGGIQYQYSTATPVLDFISTEEGRARKSGSVYKYEYDLKDHLGDTRITTTWNPSDATQMTPYNVQRNDYYAFGYVIQSTAYSIFPKNEYLYNHKELQEETGLYDYGARFYDPVIARWTSVDPLADHLDQIDKSPFAYCWNNPANSVDPDGRFVFLIPLAIWAIESGAVYFASAAIVATVVVHHATSARYASQSASSEPQQEPEQTQSTSEKKRGVNNPNVKQKVEEGKKKHKELKDKVNAKKDKGWQAEPTITDPNTGDTLRPDALTPDGSPVELKPNTPSGRAKGKSQLGKYEKATGKKGRVIYYDPKPTPQPQPTPQPTGN
jgi:RHS repeat-associated protein